MASDAKHQGKQDHPPTSDSAASTGKTAKGTEARKANYKNTCLRVDRTLWAKFRIKCLEQDRTVTDALHELIAEFVAKD